MGEEGEVCFRLLLFLLLLLCMQDAVVHIRLLSAFEGASCCSCFVGAVVGLHHLRTMR